MKHRSSWLKRNHRFSSADRAAAFLRSVRSFAKLSTEETEVLAPIVVDVAENRISKKDLIEMARNRDLDPRFHEEREGSTSAERLSPLGLALSYLFNNFKFLQMDRESL